MFGDGLHGRRTCCVHGEVGHSALTAGRAAGLPGPPLHPDLRACECQCGLLSSCSHFCAPRRQKSEAQAGRHVSSPRPGLSEEGVGSPSFLVFKFGARVPSPGGMSVQVLWVCGPHMACLSSAVSTLDGVAQTTESDHL